MRRRGITYGYERFLLSRQGGRNALLTQPSLPVLLARENGLTAELEEGDILYLPPPPARTYRVGVTDTEETLSARFHRPAKEIFSENGIEYLFPFLVLSV